MKEFSQTDIITLNGSPLQRGRIHGETFRSKIHELINRWHSWLATIIGSSPDSYIQKLVYETKFEGTIKRLTPDLLEEIRGISEGAGVDFLDIYAFQLQDEEWWFRQEYKRYQAEQSRNCSSIGWQRPTSLVAQNMDMPDYLDGYQIILRIVDVHAEVESLVFTTTGLLALNGMNNQSIGIVCNNLSQLNHSREGLPVAYIHRAVLTKKTFNDAKLFLESITHASGQNYLLGGSKEIIDLECSANQVAGYTLPSQNNRACHTNHPFVNTDLERVDSTKSVSINDLSNLFNNTDVDSCTRFDVLSRQVINLDSRGFSPEIAKELLKSHESDSHPICRHSKPGLPWMTLGTTIMELSSNPQFHVCPGPPCSSVFTKLNFLNQ